MADELMQEKIQSAVIIETFRKDIEFIRLTLNNISNNMDKFALKSETDEIKKDFTEVVNSINKAMAKHYLDDEVSFDGLRNQTEKLGKTMSSWIGGLAVISFLAPIIIIILQIFYKL